MPQEAKRSKDDVAAVPPVVHDAPDEDVTLQSPTGAGEPFVVVVKRRAPEVQEPSEDD
jgi:hypothetical protein